MEDYSHVKWVEVCKNQQYPLISGKYFCMLCDKSTQEIHFEALNCVMDTKAKRMDFIGIDDKDVLVAYLSGLPMPDVYFDIADRAQYRKAILEAIRTHPEVFLYHGYHFFPYAVLNSMEILNSIEHDSVLDMSAENGYDQEDFLMAAKHPESRMAQIKKADLYYCAENGHLYFPAKRELFQYIGSPDNFTKI